MKLLQNSNFIKDNLNMDLASSMLNLPNELLIMIMKQLEANDLYQLSKMCQRLQRLTLDSSIRISVNLPDLVENVQNVKDDFQFHLFGLFCMVLM